MENGKTLYQNTTTEIRYLRAFIRHQTAQWAQVPRSLKAFVPCTAFLTKRGAKDLLIAAVNHGINKRGIADFERRSQKYFEYCYDHRRIEEFTIQRIKSSGSQGILRTSKMRRKYPQINNQVKADC